ncbi:Hint domain-containing protein [Roseobacter sinensis]|uniref:Hint domain-containing protein n=1 Tax=Roseobacter sinensis TaxID=2931391 RepID=A0ABT3BFV1_9RHOB|nr:Hint domain-containing protein [Roseobacter sp. WL0113]MCV3272448.1 Hint domain-containing protein [Roseobacter sp. WL0113]
MIVVSGANEGDALSFAADLSMDDIYELTEGTACSKLALHCDATGAFLIAPDTELGPPGASVHVDSLLTFMAQNAPVTEVLILVQTDAQGHAEDVFALPLAPLAPKTEYQLVGIDRTEAVHKLAQIASVSFTRSTQITLGSGRQMPIEDLHPGDEVLTRDDGVQPIRWIGQSTLRAVGEFAPIRITAGTLNNTRDLVVSPDHRLLIYQRTDRLGAGRPEVLVKARHLVNGTTVTVDQGGFVDYFQLLFDTHQIIYAEGIAAESMLLDGRTAALLPPDLRTADGEPHHRSDMTRLEVQEEVLKRADAAEILRRASLR